MQTPSPSALTLVEAPASSTSPDSVPAELAAVVQLFERSLADISFPDVDARRLRSLADEVAQSALAVQRARDALSEAENAASAAARALRSAAQHALAYARIYADADPARQALRGELDALGAVASPAGTKPAPSPTGKKRGRPRKVQADPLFAVPPASEPGEAPQSA